MCGRIVVADSRAAAKAVLGPEYEPGDTALLDLALEYGQRRTAAKAATTLSKYRGPWSRFVEFVQARTKRYNQLAVKGQNVAMFL